MSKKIVVNGCSFTEERYFSKENKWSTQIGCTLNLAHGGGSNDRIFHTTIDYLNQHTPDVIIIGWTSIQRGMLYSSKGTRLIVSNGHTFDEELGTTHEDIQKFYYEKLHNEFINLRNTLNYMIHLQNYCLEKKIKILYWNALLPALDSLDDYANMAFMSRRDKNTQDQGIKYNRKILEGLLAKLNHGIWIKKFWYGINDHCENFKWRDDGHVAEEGSAHWAKLVKQCL